MMLLFLYKKTRRCTLKKIIVILVILIAVAIVVSLRHEQILEEELRKKEEFLMKIEKRKIEAIKKKRRKDFISSIGKKISSTIKEEAKRKVFIIDGEMCFIFKNTDDLTDKEKRIASNISLICSPLAELESDHIQVSVEKQRFYAIENDEVVFLGKVSTGAVSGTTPKGIHRIQNQAEYTISRKYKCPLIHWMAVTKDAMIGLHALSGTAYEGRLGSPASHGCIRLSHSDAKKLFEWVSKIKKENSQYSQVYIY
uniref:Murein L,D-transpeptidase n=1 Tax=candidate division CPR3 bacterium TaxID=2268181 RepID=A0A7C4LZX7_UNCC3